MTDDDLLDQFGGDSGGVPDALSGQSSGGSGSAFPAPPAEAIDHLRKNPHLTKEFDEVFGAGSSNTHLNVGTSPLAREIQQDGTLDAITRQAERTQAADGFLDAAQKWWSDSSAKYRSNVYDRLNQRGNAGGLLGDAGKLDPEGRKQAAESELATARTVEPIAKDVAAAAKSANEIAQQLPTQIPGGGFANVARGVAAVSEGLFGAYSKEQTERLAHAEKMARGEAELPQHAMWRSSLDTLARSVGDFALAKPAEFAGIVGGMAGEKLGVDTKPLDNPVYNFGKRIEEKAKELFPEDKGRQYEFATKVTEGLGSTAAFGGTGLMVRILGAGEKGALAAIALSGAAGQVPDEFEKATKAIEAGTATEQDRFINMLANIGLGMTEVIPFAPNFAAKGTVGARAAVKRAGEQVVEETAQEVGQQAGSNIAAQQTYDPTRDPYQGVLEGGMVAGITGGVFGGAMSGKVGRGEQAQQAAEERKRQVDEIRKRIDEVSGKTDPALETVRPDLPAMTKAPDRTGADIAAAPAFNDVLRALPKDANGDPDLAPLIEELSARGQKAWAGLTPEQRQEVYQRFAPVADAITLAAQEATGGQAQPVGRVTPSEAGPATTDDMASLEDRFNAVLASKTRRADWATTIGVKPEQLQPLIDAAVKDGRLKMVRGQPVRTAKAATKPTPRVPAVQGGTTPTAQPSSAAALGQVSDLDQLRQIATGVGAGWNSREDAAGLQRRITVRLNAVREGDREPLLQKAMRDAGVAQPAPAGSADQANAEMAARRERLRAKNEQAIAKNGGSVPGIVDVAQQMGKLQIVTVDDRAPDLGGYRPGQDKTDDFKRQLVNGEFKTIVDARRAAREAGITETGKALDERIEVSLVETAREIAASAASPADAYQQLVTLYENQPNLGVRTSTSIANQAYSTPLPLAYLSSRLAGVTEAGVVYEPTAGNGALLIEASPTRQTVVANELDPKRAEALRDLGFTATSGDATNPRQAHEIRRTSPAGTVIMNPPFGAVKVKGKSKEFEVFKTGYAQAGYWTTQIDHAIALQGLEAMADDGRAVLILGGVNATDTDERRKGYRGKAKREFFVKLYGEYNVTDHFTVSGDLYKKQGAGWPVDVVVIEGRGKSKRTLPAAVPPVIFDSWDALAEKLPDGQAKETGVRAAQDDGTDSRPSVPTDLRVGQPESGDEGGGRPVARGRTDRPPAPARRDAGGVQPGDDRRQYGNGADAGNVQGDAQPVVAQPDRDARGTDQQLVTRKQRVKRETKGGQAPYEPASNVLALDTLIPVNMASAARAAMQRVEDEHGPVDNFVAERLGYEIDERGQFFINSEGVKVRPFSAEQVDAIAAAITNVENGSALIIGDQTGIGKGRIVAAMLRYAMKRGQIPVLVTEKPDLYGDMYRDLRDIGVPEMLGREFRMLQTATGVEPVPLDETAVEWKQEAEAAKTAGEKAPTKRGLFLTSLSTAKWGDAAQAVAAGQGEYDIVVSTYDQMNTVRGQTTPRRAFLAQIAPRALIAFDEAHNAGGAAKTGWENKNAPVTRADFARELARDAAGVIFSSATYAKRPDVMDLYARTDMGKAVSDPKDLPMLIQRGGVPMQQIVASMLSDAGQYMRRERSFDGVEYAIEPVPVDADTYRQFSTAIRSVFKFDLAVKGVKKEVMKDLLDRAGAAQSNDTGVGEAAAHTTSFSSLMHNIVNQMLLAIKANETGRRAVEAFKAGEKPIIALANTNESFIKNFAEQEGISIGDVLDLDFGAVLRRYLDRTLRITVKHGKGVPSEHIQIPVTDLPLHLQEQFRQAMAEIDAGDYAGLPISPIDAIRYQLTKAGMSVAEVTGRQTMIDYGNKSTYVARPRKEQGPAGKRGSIAAFNAGKLDALILNRSGSTGVSMHAGEKFKDQRKRRMILAQAEGNIDTHLQMLGRVHRTGQVIPPAYSQIAAEIPAEMRPTAVLMKKMASLNANTTGARGSVFMADAADIMNEVGDKVVMEFIRENPEIEQELGGDVLTTGDDGLPSAKDAAKRATGRLVLLDPEKQTEFLDAIQSGYKAALEELDALGENPLEAKTMDLQARVLETTELKAASGDGPFLAAATIEKISAKAAGRSMSMAEVAAEVAKAIGQPNPEGDPLKVLTFFEGVGREWASKQAASIRARFNEWLPTILKDLSDEAKVSTTERERAGLDRITALLGSTYPGARVSLTTHEGELNGVVIGVERKGSSKSPAAPGAWTVSIAVPDSMRVIKLSMARLFPSTMTMKDNEKGAKLSRSWDSFSDIAAAMDKARLEGREVRYIVTGNILAGFEQVEGQGRIVNFTNEDGSLRPGVLLGRDFDVQKFMGNRAVRFADGAHVAAFLDQIPRGTTIRSLDGHVAMVARGGEYTIQTAASRAKGGRYFTDQDVRDAIAPVEFIKTGTVMTARVGRDQFVKAVDAIMAAGAKLETRSHQDIAQRLGPQIEAPASKATPPPLPSAPGSAPDADTPPAVEQQMEGRRDRTYATGGGWSDGSARDRAVRMLQAGRHWQADADTMAGVREAVASLPRNILPADTDVGFLIEAWPLPGGNVRVGFEMPDGTKRFQNYSLLEFSGARAVFDPRIGTVAFFTFDLPPQISHRLTRELWHEAIHALRAAARVPGVQQVDVLSEGGVGQELGAGVRRPVYLDDARFNLLVSHATDLRILDTSLRTFSRAIGDPQWEDMPDDVSLLDEYTRLYGSRGRSVLREALAEEAVAHMTELLVAGVTLPLPEPIRQVYEELELGALGGRGPAMFARTFYDPVAGREVTTAGTSPEAEAKWSAILDQIPVDQAEARRLALRQGQRQFFSREAVAQREQMSRVAKHFDAIPIDEIVDLNDAPERVAAYETSQDEDGTRTFGRPMFAFAGPKAVGAPVSVLRSAEMMEAKGRKPAQIRAATGWFRGPDNKWRFEIDDSAAKLTNLDTILKDPPRSIFRMALGLKSKKQPKWVNGKVKLATGVKLSDMLSHDKLFKAYPFLKTMRVNVMIGAGVPAEKEGGSITFRKADGKLVYSPIMVRARTEGEVLKTLMHEVQHYIQNKEGFAGGSAPSSRRPKEATLKFGMQPTATGPIYPGVQFSPNTIANAETARAGDTLPFSKAEELALSMADMWEERDKRERGERGRWSSIWPTIADLDDHIQGQQAELVELLRVTARDYEAASGEREANEVMNRLTLTPEQRRNTPVEYGGDARPGFSGSFKDAADEMLRRAQFTKRMRKERSKPFEIAPGIKAAWWSPASDNSFHVYTDFTNNQDGATLYIDVDRDTGRALISFGDTGRKDLGDWRGRELGARSEPMTDQRLSETVDAAEKYLRSINLTATADPRLLGRKASDVSDAEFAFWRARDPYFMIDDVRAVANGVAWANGKLLIDGKEYRPVGIGQKEAIDFLTQWKGDFEMAVFHGERGAEGLAKGADKDVRDAALGFLRRMRERASAVSAIATDSDLAKPMPADLRAANLDNEMWKARTGEHETGESDPDLVPTAYKAVPHPTDSGYAIKDKFESYVLETDQRYARKFVSQKDAEMQASVWNRNEEYERLRRLEKRGIATNAAQRPMFAISPRILHTGRTITLTTQPSSDVAAYRSDLTAAGAAISDLPTIEAIHREMTNQGIGAVRWPDGQGGWTYSVWDDTNVTDTDGLEPDAMKQEIAATNERAAVMEAEDLFALSTPDGVVTRTGRVFRDVPPSMQSAVARVSLDGDVGGVFYRGVRSAAQPVFASGFWWGSSDPLVASGYATASEFQLDHWGESGLSIAPAVIPGKMHFRNPLIVNASGSDFAHIPYNGRTYLSNELAQHALSAGYDGLLIKNVTDNTGHVDDNPISNVVVALRKSTVISAYSGLPMFAIDARTGQSMRRDLDALGYYSKLDEVLTSLGPKDTKTGAEWLSELRRLGVRDAEISARGLDSVLVGESLASFDARFKPVYSDAAQRRAAEMASLSEELKNRPSDDRKRDIIKRRMELSKAGKNEAQSSPPVELLQRASEAVPAGDLVKAAGKVELRESEYSGGRWQDNAARQLGRWIEQTWPTASREQRENMMQARSSLTGAQTHEDARAALARNRIPQNVIDEVAPERYVGTGTDGGRKAKWSAYSLDPSNPSYRETVLHLPADRADDFSVVRHPTESGYALQRRDGTYATYPEGDVARWERQDYARMAIEQDPEQFQQRTFRSGHFPEPNIVGHMLTSMTKHEGKPVYTIDQIQSDWGQKLRDGGVRDEAKIAGLKQRLEEVERPRREWLMGEPLAFVRQHIPSMRVDDVTPMEIMGNIARIARNAVDGKKFSENVLEQASTYRLDPRMSADGSDLIRAEIRTAKAATPGHPLVNTTDQWTTTTLRRAIRQAAEADAAYIAIPHGDTVLSYNPGDEAGMRGFYGSRTETGIVPKNLRNILSKLDKDAPTPQRVEKLETSHGLQGWQGDKGSYEAPNEWASVGVKKPIDPKQTGFTLFTLTDKVKEIVKTQGQPMFAFAGERARTADLNALAKAQQMEAAGEDRTTIWTDTGWFRGVEGKWRFEIDDSGLRVDLNSVRGKSVTHPELFRAYNSAADSRFYAVKDALYEGRHKLTSDGTSAIDISTIAKQPRNVAGHELQHHVQETEGFAGGAQYAGDYDAYRKAAGEVEARAVEQRLNLAADERRARPPWLDYDVPEDQQIVRFANGESQSTDPMFALDMSPEARKARAEAMGFDTSRVWYQSELQPKTEFKPHGKFMGRWGVSGISLTDNSEMASRYLDRYGDMGWVDGKPYQPFHKAVGAYYVKRGNYKTITKPIAQRLALGMPLPEGYTWPAELDGYDGVIVIDAINGKGKSVGHVDPSKKGAVVGQELILRDPSNIRSVNAAFDPEQSDSANLMFAIDPTARRRSDASLDAIVEKLTDAIGMTLSKGLRSMSVTRGDVEARVTHGPAEVAWDAVEAYRQWAEAVASWGKAAVGTSGVVKLPGEKEALEALREYGEYQKGILKTSRWEGVFGAHPETTAMLAAARNKSEAAWTALADVVGEDLRLPLTLAFAEAGFDFANPSLLEHKRLRDKVRDAIRRVLRSRGVEIELVPMPARNRKAAKRRGNVFATSGVRAQYDNYSGVARMRSLRVLDEVAHEGAHHLERLFGAGLLDLQMQFRSELEGLTIPGAAETPSEQWAEFFRLYVTNVAAAQIAAPGLYAAFEDLVEAEVPGMLDQLGTLHDMVERYNASTPLEQVSADLVATRHRNALSRAIGSYRDGTLAGDISVALSQFYTATIDRMNPIWHFTSAMLEVAAENGVKDADGKPISLRVSENPYKQFRAFAGSYKKGHNWLIKGIRDPLTDVQIAPPLRDALLKVFGNRPGSMSTVAAAGGATVGAIAAGPLGAVIGGTVGSAVYTAASDLMFKTGWDRKRYQEFNAYIFAIAALERYRQYEEKQRAIADVNQALADAAQSRPALADRARKDAAILERRQTAAVRIDTLLKDRRRARQVADTALRNAAKGIDEKKDALLAAQMAREPGLISRRKKSLDEAEAAQKDLVKQAEALAQEVDGLEVSQAMIESEIDQLKAAADDSAGRVEGLDAGVADLRAMRERELGTGIHRPPVLEPKAKLERVLLEAEAKYPQFQAAAEVFHEYVHGLLIMEHRAGFHTDEAFAALSKNRLWYAPLMRDMSDIRDAKRAGMDGRKWSPLQALKGSDRAVINPVDVIIERSYQLARKTAFDTAVKTMVDLTRSVGPGHGAIAEEVSREETLAANRETFDRITANAKALGLDDTEAKQLLAMIEHESTASDLQMLFTASTKGPKPGPRIPYWENGERKLLQINDAEFAQEIFDAVNGIGEDLSNIMIRAVAAPSRWLSFGVTAHPAFAIVNMTRDMMAAWITTGATPIYTQAKGIAMELATHKTFDTDAWRAWSPTWIRNKVADWNEFVRKYHDVGGIRGGQFAASIGDTKDKGEYRGLRETGFHISWNKIWDLIEISETSTRLGVARAAYKRAKAFDPTLSDTEAVTEAAFVSRDVLDFDRRGSKMGVMTRLVAFMNPNLQGMDKAIRSSIAQGDRRSLSKAEAAGAMVGMIGGVTLGGPVGFAVGGPAGMQAAAGIRRLAGIVMKNDAGVELSEAEERDKIAAYKFWYRLMAFNALVIGIYLLHAGDPEEEEINDRLKESHVMLDIANIWHNLTNSKLGKALGFAQVPKNDSDWKRAPLPFELATPAVIGIWALRTHQDKDPHAYARLWDSLHGLLAPPVVPQAVKIIGEPIYNSSSFTGRPIVPADLQTRSPAERYEWFTSTIAKNIGQALGVAPIKVDYVITNGLGYIGREIQRYGEWVLPGGKQKPGQDESMLTKRVKADPYRGSNVMSEFYNQTKSDGGTGGPVSVIKGIILDEGTRYVEAAKDYKDAVNESGVLSAKLRVAKLPDEMRAYAYLQTHFNTNAQNMHPINRLDRLVQVMNKVQKEIVTGELKEAIGARARRNVTLDTVLRPDPQQEETLLDIINRLKVTEAHNTFRAIGHGRWGQSKELPTDLVLDELKAANEKVYDELMKRVMLTKVPSLDGAAAAWKKAKPDLLKNQEEATLSDATAELDYGQPQLGKRDDRRPAKVKIPAR